MPEPRDSEVAPVFRPERGADVTAMPTIAETLEKSAALDRLLSAPLTARKPSIMSKLAEMAERARTLRAQHRALADKAGEKMSALDQRGQAALATMERVLADHEKDIATLEGELRQMTNDAPTSSA